MVHADEADISQYLELVSCSAGERHTRVFRDAAYQSQNQLLRFSMHLRQGKEGTSVACSRYAPMLSL